MSAYLGEFEQMVLLAILQLDEEAYAIDIRRVLGESAGRSVTRGALYRTLDRLETKGMLAWESREPTAERGGHSRRRFRVTPAGVELLRSSRSALLRLWSGLDAVLGQP